MHLRVETPLTREAESMESPVKIFNGYLVSALERRVNSVASAVEASGGTIEMRLELVSSKRTSKYDDPERKLMTRLSQLDLSLESY